MFKTFCGVFALTLTSACGANIEEMDELDSQQTAVIAGSTNWTGKNLLRYRTASIYQTVVPGSGSGTFLTPDLVLTARHVVTSNGKIGGTLIPASSVRVRIGNFAPVPGAGDICTGPGRTPECSVGAEIYAINASTDLAIIRLQLPVSHAQMPLPFTPLALGTLNSSDVHGTNRFFTGWGRNGCVGGSLGLRWGTTNVQWEVTNLRLVETVSGQAPWRGDSGGPTWADHFAGSPQIGVHSWVEDCGDQGYDVSVMGDVYPSQWIDNIIASNMSNVSAPLSSLSEVDLEAVAGSSPNWVISNGRLTQATNAPSNFALVKNAVYHQRVDTATTVTIQGWDDDQAGVVINYVDSANFTLCQVNVHSHRLQLINRRFGVSHVEASKVWNGTFASDVIVRAETNEEQGLTQRCEISGGGVASDFVSTSLKDGPYAGRVGVYNNNNQNISYRNFSVVPN